MSFIGGGSLNSLLEGRSMTSLASEASVGCVSHNRHPSSYTSMLGKDTSMLQLDPGHDQPLGNACDTVCLAAIRNHVEGVAYSTAQL